MCTVIVYKQLLDLMFHLLVVVLNKIGTYKCDLYSIYTPFICVLVELDRNQIQYTNHMLDKTN